jgi:hypothetical protein
MPSRWVQAVALLIGIVIGWFSWEALWASSTTLSVPAQGTPDPPTVLTVVVERVTTATPTPTPTLLPYQLTQTAAPTATRAPLMPTATMTPAFNPERDTEAG